MKTMREKFENLAQIKNILEYNESDNIVFDEEKQEYKAELYTTFVPEYIEWINGAWCAFQEQQKKIYAVLQYISDEKWMDEYGDYHCPVLKIQELLNESQQE